MPKTIKMKQKLYKQLLSQAHLTYIKREFTNVESLFTYFFNLIYILNFFYYLDFHLRFDSLHFIAQPNYTTTFTFVTNF